MTELKSKLLGAVCALLVLAAVGSAAFALGHVAGVESQAPAIDQARKDLADERADLSVCTARAGDLAATVTAQNSSIEAAAADSERRKAEAAAKLRAAQIETAEARRSAARILSLTAPAGDGCEAAQALISSEVGE